MNTVREALSPARKVTLSAAALFAVIVALAALGRPGTALACTAIIGDFTGEIAAGGPVYQLPTINIVASRRVELPRIDAAERATRELRAKAGRTPHAAAEPNVATAARIESRRHDFLGQRS